MKNKMFATLGIAALVVSVAFPAAAAEAKTRHKIARHQLSSAAVAADARTRDAYDAWRPAVPAAAYDEAARYHGTIPIMAGH